MAGTAKRSGKSGKSTAAQSAVAGNRNFRARVLFKSGTIQELMVVEVDTNVFDDLRQGFQQFLSSGSPTWGSHPVGTFIVRWSEVEALHTWLD